MSSYPMFDCNYVLDYILGVEHTAMNKTEKVLALLHFGCITSFPPLLLRQSNIFPLR